MLKLCNIYKLFTSVLGYKFIKQNYCSQNFELNQNIYGTRRANLLLKIPNSTCAAGNRSAHFKLPCLWNELVNSPFCDVISGSNTVYTFKKSLKSVLLNDQS